MVTPPAYRRLLSAATLGTARRPLDAEVTAWLRTAGLVAPETGDAEQLLAALSVAERTHRLRPRSAGEFHGTAVRPAEAAPTVAPPESAPPPGSRLAGALRLILEGSYPGQLDEAVDTVLARGTYVPAVLLPALHRRAAALLEENPARADAYVSAGGHRAIWLARQHPDWQRLDPDYDFAAAFRTELLPSRRAQLLAEWRRRDSAGARTALAGIWDGQSPRNQELLLRGLEPELGAADLPWLRAALAPQRRGVRRKLTRLLLRAGDAATTADLSALAARLFDGKAGLRSLLPNDGAKRSLRRYGGPARGDTPAIWLLRVLPAEVWAETTGEEPTSFWRGLRPPELRAAAVAVRDYAHTDQLDLFLRLLLVLNPTDFPPARAAELATRLPRAAFDGLFADLLTAERDALRPGGLARTLALGRQQSWSERLSRAMVSQLVTNLRDRRLDYATQRQLATDWKRAIPLLDPAIFPWLRQQLGPVTERPDVFGRLATTSLQTTSFRRAAFGSD